MSVYEFLANAAKSAGFKKQTKTSRRFFGPFFRLDVILAQERDDGRPQIIRYR